MADLSDIESALVGTLLGLLYPSGLDTPCLCGMPVRIYRGLPLAGPLARDLDTGISNISVSAVPDTTRNCTRWFPPSQVIPGVATLTVSVTDASASFSGIGGPGQLAGLLVDGQAFVHRGSDNDTPALVAALLAASIRVTRSCWLSGSTVSIPGARRLLGRVVADGTTTTEWARQEQSFQISAWCPNPSARDAICSAVGSAFASVSFIALPDNTAGRLRYQSTQEVDICQDAQQYRRDLVYTVEYGTVSSLLCPTMIFGQSDLAGNPTFC